jgi:hypothetical protein
MKSFEKIPEIERTSTIFHTEASNNSSVLFLIFSKREWISVAFSFHNSAAAAECSAPQKE